MQKMKFFIDTHSAANDTLPKGLTPQQFEAFFSEYITACEVEGVIILRTHIAYDDGLAFCFTMAPDAEAVRRAHDRVGLPFDAITEVETATPGDTSFLAGNA